MRLEVIEETKIDAEANAGEHHFGHDAGLHANGLFDGEEVLFEVQIVDRDTENGSVTELGCGREGYKQYGKSKHKG